MPKAATSSNAFTIIRPFEGLALFQQFIPAKGKPGELGYQPSWVGYAATVDGEFEVTVDMNVAGGDWIISDLWLSIENGKIGSDCRDAKVNLSGDTDEKFMFLVMDALMNQYGTWIEDVVQDELSEARYCRSDAA